MGCRQSVRLYSMTDGDRGAIDGSNDDLNTSLARGRVSACSYRSYQSYEELTPGGNSLINLAVDHRPSTADGAGGYVASSTTSAVGHNLPDVALVTPNGTLYRLAPDDALQSDSVDDEVDRERPPASWQVDADGSRDHAVDDTLTASLDSSSKPSESRLETRRSPSAVNHHEGERLLDTSPDVDVQVGSKGYDDEVDLMTDGNRLVRAVAVIDVNRPGDASDGTELRYSPTALVEPTEINGADDPSTVTAVGPTRLLTVYCLLVDCVALHANNIALVRRRL